MVASRPCNLHIYPGANIWIRAIRTPRLAVPIGPPQSHRAVFPAPVIPKRHATTNAAVMVLPAHGDMQTWLSAPIPTRLGTACTIQPTSTRLAVVTHLPPIPPALPCTCL